LGTLAVLNNLIFGLASSLGNLQSIGFGTFRHGLKSWYQPIASMGVKVLTNVF